MIQVELRDRSNQKLQILTGAIKAAYHPVLNGDGSGMFQIHRADPDVARYGLLDPAAGIEGYIVHLLRKGPLEATFTDRFSFQVEAVGFGLDQGEEQSGWITVAGRGTLSLLEGRTCWPPGFNEGAPNTSITNQWQIYAGVAGGAIMDAEIDRSASRFTPALTHTVQGSTVLQTAKLRFDDLRLLHDYLVQAGPMDAQMYGLDYQCVDRRGSDRSATVKVQLGPQDSLLGMTLARDARAVKNWIVAQGTGEGINSKLAVAQDAASIAALRRREGFLDARQVDNQAQLALTAAGSLAQFKAIDQRITVRFTDSPHTQLYRDFDLGDTIGAVVVPVGLDSKYRVVGFAVADVGTEIEEISLDLNSMRQEYLIKLLQGTVMPAVGSLSTLSRQPQGAPYNNSKNIQENCTPPFPGHFDVFIESNVLKLNYAKLSFKLRAFRRDFALVAGSSTSSGASSASSSNNVGHLHYVTVLNNAAPPGNPVFFDGASLWSAHISAFYQTDSDAGHSHTIAHTHTFTPSVAITDGIFETTVATGVLVIINGVDRTTALGGGTGFTADQTELEVSQWLNIGAWNTVDLTPAGLGRISAELRLTGWLQSV